MPSPLLSVVMPVYNSEDYLTLAVESILNQTFSDFEVIIIDDGSTDKTAEILDRYRDRRIIHLQNEKYLGLARSLNRGLTNARGKFIARMDADDISLPRRFELQVRHAEAHPEIGLLGGWAELIDDNGKHLGVWRVPTSPALVKWANLFSDSLIHPSVIIRRSVIERVGFYSARALHAEDYDLWCRICFETEIANLPEVLIRHRVHSGSVSVQHSKRQEQTSVSVARSAISRVLGYDISLETATWLHRTVRRFPLQTGDQVRSVALLIEALLKSYASKFCLNASDKRIVSMDAAERMLRLSRINFTSWPEQSLAVVLLAIEFEPRLFYLAALKMFKRFLTISMVRRVSRSHVVNPVQVEAASLREPVGRVKQSY
jgi:glycosyltransferase involved in cell wall biosynthesis